MYDNLKGEINEFRLKAAERAEKAEYYKKTLETDRANRASADKQVIDLLHNVRDRYETKLESYMAKHGNKKGADSEKQDKKSTFNNEKDNEIADGWGNKSSNDSGNQVKTDKQPNSGKRGKKGKQSPKKQGDTSVEQTTPEKKNDVNGWGSTDIAENNQNNSASPAEEEPKSNNTTPKKTDNIDESGWGTSKNENGWGTSNKENDWGTSNKENDWGTSNNETGGGTSKNENGWGASNNETGGRTSNNEGDWGTSNKENDWGTSNNETGEGTSNKENGWGTSNKENSWGSSNNETDGGTSSKKTVKGPSNNETVRGTNNNKAGRGTSNNETGSGNKKRGNNVKEDIPDLKEPKNETLTIKLERRLAEREAEKLANELASVKKERDDLYKKYGLLVEEQDTLKIKLRGATVDLISANEEIHKLNTKLDELETDRRIKDREVGFTENRRRSIENKYRSYQQQIADLESELKVTKEEKEEQEKKAVEFGMRIERLEGDLIHSRRLIQTLKDGCSLVEGQAKTFEIRHESVVMSKADLERELVSIKEESSRHITTISKLQKANEQVSKAFIMSVEAHEQCKKETDTLQREYSRKLESYKLENLRLLEANGQLRKLVDYLQKKQTRKF